MSKATTLQDIIKSLPAATDTSGKSVLLTDTSGAISKADSIKYLSNVKIGDLSAYSNLVNDNGSLRISRNELINNIVKNPDSCYYSMPNANTMKEGDIVCIVYYLVDKDNYPVTVFGIANPRGNVVRFRVIGHTYIPD